MTDRPAHVLVVSLQVAQPKTDQKSRQIDTHHKRGSEDQQRSPQHDHSATVEHRQLQLDSVPRSVMREMAGPPERLRKTFKLIDMFLSEYFQYKIYNYGILKRSLALYERA